MRRTAAARTVLLLLLAGAPASAADVPPPGAAACSGCHPAGKLVDTPVARLIGRNPAEIVAAMQTFRSGQKPASVMDKVARGFSDDEIKAIANWYGAQKD